MKFLKLKMGYLPKDTLTWQLERFEWLVSHLCPTYGPLRSAFLQIQNSNFLDAPIIPNTDDEAVLQAYAQSYLDQVRHQIGMGNWYVSFIARDKALPKRNQDKEFIEIGRAKPVERYYTDALGRPILYFEIQKLTTPGYLTRRIAMGLSGLIMVMTPKPNNVEADDYHQLINIVAAFLGFGLVPTLLPEHDEDLTETQIKQQIFATTIFLKLKGYSYKKLHTLYGEILEQEILQEFQNAFKALEPYMDKVMRLKAQALAAETQNMAITG